MVTATLAGMLLNWTAPLFLVALAALVAVGSSRSARRFRAVAELLIAGRLRLTLVYACSSMRFGCAMDVSGRRLAPRCWPPRHPG